MSAASTPVRSATTNALLMAVNMLYDSMKEKYTLTISEEAGLVLAKDIMDKKCIPTSLPDFSSSTDTFVSASFYNHALSATTPLLHLVSITIVKGFNKCQSENKDIKTFTELRGLMKKPDCLDFVLQFAYKRNYFLSPANRAMIPGTEDRSIPPGAPVLQANRSVQSRNVQPRSFYTCPYGGAHMFLAYILMLDVFGKTRNKQKHIDTIRTVCKNNNYQLKIPQLKVYEMAAFMIKTFANINTAFRFLDALNIDILSVICEQLDIQIDSFISKLDFVNAIVADQDTQRTKHDRLFDDLDEELQKNA